MAAAPDTESPPDTKPPPTGPAAMPPPGQADLVPAQRDDRPRPGLESAPLAAGPAIGGGPGEAAVGSGIAALEATNKGSLFSFSESPGGHGFGVGPGGMAGGGTPNGTGTGGPGARLGTGQSGLLASRGGGGGGGGGISLLVLIRQQIERARIYPEAARQAGHQGTVELRFRIGADGSVASLEIMRSSGFPVLDRASEETIRRAAPYPVVSGWIRLPLSYRLE